MLVRHRQVDDGEHHEDEGLQQHDQDVEDRPARAQDAGEDRAGKAGGGPDPEQDEDDLAGVHVAEQPQRVRERLGDVLDEIEEEIE